jgi:tetratricopeptide (TPR) repeat protein
LSLVALGIVGPGRAGILTRSCVVEVFPGSSGKSRSLPDFNKTERRGRIWASIGGKLFHSLNFVLVAKGFAMTRIKPVFCFLILGLISTPVAADEDIFKIGVEALNKKDYYFAVACFSDVLQHDPQNAKVYNFRALAYQGRGKWEGAIEDFTEVIRLQPKFPDVYMNRGNAFFQKKDYEKAVQDFTHVIGFDSKNALAYINRANVYKQLKNKKAFEDFATAIRLTPRDPRPYLDRADAYLSDKDYEKAVQDFDAVTRFDAKNPQPYLGRGDVYAQKKEYENAIREYSEAIRLDPKNYQAFLKRAEVFRMKGDMIKSIEDYNKSTNILRDTLNELPPGLLPPRDWWDWPDLK